MKETPKTLFPWAKKIDISMEKYRSYRFPGGDIVQVDSPQFLIVSDNGHRIADASGISHYIPYKWIELTWENRDENDEKFFCTRGEEEKNKLIQE